MRPADPAPHRRAPRPRRARRGAGLIELLVAVALLGLGSAALLRLHGQLRLGSELARQRAVALRLAEQEMERLRSYRRLQGADSWAAIATRPAAEWPGVAEPGPFTLAQQVDTHPDLPLKALRLQVAWSDRHGQARQFVLPGLIAAVDPVLVGALLLRRDDGRPGGAFGRHPLLPPDARTLPDGRVLLKPDAGGTRAWIVDAVSAEVRQRCRAPAGLAVDALTAADLGDCEALSGLLVGGVVRFATAHPPPDLPDPEQPLGLAMDLDLRLQLDSRGHPEPAWECTDDAPAGVPPAATLQSVVRWLCVVQPAGNPPRWSGRLELQPRGWTIAAEGRDAYRVCRYSADHDGNGRIDAAEHPARQVDVRTPLGDQNFLVVPADAACPRDPGGGLDAGDPVDDSTWAHQP